MICYPGSVQCLPVDAAHPQIERYFLASDVLIFHMLTRYDHQCPNAIWPTARAEILSDLSSSLW